jgi:peptidoglycan/LPS O-acetylase OafA/YrhL
LKTEGEDSLKDWHLNPSSSRDYEFLDGLRGIAILIVVLDHLIYTNPKSSVWIHFIGGIFGMGATGVPLFFTLSGFLISWPFWKLKAEKRPNCVPSGYGWRRFYKIYPPLALSIVVLTPLYVLQSHNWEYLRVMWSLIIEVNFYIALPIIMICLKRCSLGQCLWIVPLALFTLGIAPRIYRTFFPESFAPDQINFGLFSLIDSFTLGTLVAGLYTAKKIRAQHAWLGNLGLCIIFITLPCGSLVNTFFPRLNPFAIELIYKISWIGDALALFFLVAPSSKLARLLSLAWLRWLGIISYEWYLFHQFIVIQTRRIFGPAEGNSIHFALTIGGSFVVSLVISAFIYKFFSLPILKSGRQRNRPGVIEMQTQASHGLT